MRFRLTLQRLPQSVTPHRRTQRPPKFWRRLEAENLEERTLLSVVFTPGPYAPPAVHQPEVPLGAMSGFRPVEPALSLDPTDSENLGVSSQTGIRVSTNGGGAFKGVGSFPGSNNISMGGDTTTAYDSAGRLFWVNLTGPGLGITQVDPMTGLIIPNTNFTIDNNGKADDKPFMAIDTSPNSVFRNNIYVVWTFFGGISGSQVFFTRSIDQGHTWSAPFKLSSDLSDGFVWPATVAVGPHGEVFVAYHSLGNQGQTIVYENVLGGDPGPGGWQGKTAAFLPGQSDVTFNKQTSGRRIPGTQFDTQGSAQPWVLADPARPGNVYVIAADDPSNGAGAPYSRVYVARSTDSGANWSAPAEVAHLAGTSFQLFPTAAIDQWGDIVVAWYDNRRGLLNGANRFELDVFATYSTDGGQTWAPQQFMVNDPGNPFDPDPGAATISPGPPPTTRIGEYFGIGIFGGTAYVAWNSNTLDNNGNPNGQQVWFDSFAINGSLTLTGGGADDTVTIGDLPGNSSFVQVLVNGSRQYVGLWSALTGGIKIVGGTGQETVYVEETAVGVPVTITGPKIDTVHVGVNGSVQGIRSPVIINGSIHDLDVDDSEDAIARKGVTITANKITGLAPAPIYYGAMDILSILFGKGGNRFTVTGTPATTRTSIYSGTTKPSIVSVQATNGIVYLYGQGGADTVNVGDAKGVEDLRKPLYFNGQPQSTLNVNDCGNTGKSQSFTGTLSGSGNTDTISGLGPAIIQYTTDAPGNLNITSRLLVNIAGNAPGITVKIDNCPLAFEPPHYLLDHPFDIFGPLIFQNSLGVATITLNNAADTVARTVILDSFSTPGDTPFGRISGLAPAVITYRYAGTSNVALVTGSGGGTVNVLSTGTPFTLINSGPTTVNVGNNVGAGANGVQDIQGPLTVMNSGGSTTLTVDDSGDRTARTVVMSARGTTGSIGGLAPAAISYATTDVSAVTVLGGSGNNTYTVANTASNGGSGVLTTLVPGSGADTVLVRATTGPLIVNSGAGNNSITVGDAGSTLNGIRGALTVNGLPGSNLFTLNDQGNRASQTYTLAADTLARAGLATITYAGMQNLVLDAGSSSNTIQVLSTAAGLTTTINGGSGTTTLVGANGAEIWRITGINEGSLSGTPVDGLVTFGSVQNLVGGTGNNMFSFSDGASISGRLDGGQRGNNTLDLSGYTTNVIVDLQLGQATGVGGGIIDIQNVNGGNGGTTSNYNILVGNSNGESNVLTGGLGRRNLLIAGTSAGILVGGDNEDILIGGTTAYDMDLSALMAIMAEWTRTDEDYATRVGNLLNGRNSPVLDARTVANNGGGNTLLGHAGGSTEMNLFYGLDPNHEATDWNPALGEVFVNV